MKRDSGSLDFHSSFYFLFFHFFPEIFVSYNYVLSFYYALDMTPQARMILSV